MRSDNWNNPNVQQEIPARVIAQFLFPFSTDSQDTGKGPSIPLMGIFYTSDPRMKPKIEASPTN